MVFVFCTLGIGPLPMKALNAGSVRDGRSGACVGAGRKGVNDSAEARSGDVLKGEQPGTRRPAKRATVRVETMRFETFPYSDPDPTVRMGRIYPYHYYSGFSCISTERDWKVVVLENDHIKVLVAPEVGGKVLGAIDKTCNWDFLYLNPVMKFREIGLRGPWVSGGIEFNFGTIGHAPTASFPVDYCVRENSDGSASCFVGAEDLPSRTYWVVEIRVPGDGAYFEVNSRWFNSTAQSTSLYAWTNAAIDAAADLHLVFPGKYRIDHEGHAGPWPVDEKGRRIDYYVNNAFFNSKSYHVLGSYTNFFGAYWVGHDRGIGHLVAREERPGRKIWIWSLAQRGQIWVPLLTDTTRKGQYVEIQSGLLFNQAEERSALSPFKHAFLQPHYCVESHERWFPIHGVGDLAGANQDLAFGVSFAGDSLVLKYFALHNIVDTIVIRDGRGIVARDPVVARATQTGRIAVRLNSPQTAEVWLGGRLLFSRADSVQRMLSRPVHAPKSFKWDSPFGLYTKGVELERQREYARALEALMQSIEKEPHFVPALVGAARIFYRRMEYRRALDLLMRALGVDAYDASANYVYGLTCAALGKKFDALDGFSLASRSPSLAYAASVEMARIYLAAGQWDEAVRYGQKAMRYFVNGIDALKVLALAYKAKGDTARSQTCLTRILNQNPLDAFAVFEARQSKSTGFAVSLGDVVHNEFPEQTYLELGLFYAGYGFFRDAVEVLNASPAHPIVEVWLGWLYHQLRKEDEALYHLDKALKMSPYLVFPFRRESVAPLKWALTVRENWKLHYFLGLVLWHLGRTEQAVEQFVACGDVPRYGPFYVTRYRLMRDRRDYDPERDLLKALRLDSTDWRAFWELAQFYREVGKPGKAARVATRGVLRFEGNSWLQVQLATCYYDLGAYDKCLDLLQRTRILPYEGARYGRNLHRLAHVSIALELIRRGECPNALHHLEEAKTYPLNLGTGKPFDPDTRIEDYLAWLCQRREGESDRRDDLLEQIEQYTRRMQVKWRTSHLLGALVMRWRGRKKEAAEMLLHWLREYPNKPAVQWAWAMWNGRRQEAEQIASDLERSSRGTPWNPSPVDCELRLLRKLDALGLLPQKAGTGQ